MSDERFTIKPQDDYWAVVDNYNEDKVCIINGIHTEIEAIWLCDFMNEQQATISALKEENEQLKAARRDDAKEFSALFRQNFGLKRENEQLKKYDEVIDDE